MPAKYVTLDPNRREKELLKLMNQIKGEKGNPYAVRKAAYRESDRLNWKTNDRK